MIPKFCALGLFVLLTSCGNKTSENSNNPPDSIQPPDSVQTEADREEAIDNTPGSQAPRPSDLTIHGKEIWVRAEPGIGKVVMKLNEGDRCKVLEVGRFDVIRGNANLWYKIEFNGQQGWVFGSQTDMEGMVWPAVGCASTQFPPKKLDFISQLGRQSTMDKLWRKLGEFLKTTEHELDSTDETSASKSVSLLDGKIETRDSDDAFSTQESFERKYESGNFALVSYRCMMGGAGWWSCLNTLVVTKSNSGWVFNGQVNGEVFKVVELQNGEALVITQNIESGSPGFGISEFQIFHLRPSMEAIEWRQSLGFSVAGFVDGIPNAWRDDELAITVVGAIKMEVTSKEKSATPKLLLTEGSTPGSKGGVRHYDWSGVKRIFEEVPSTP